MLTAETKLRLIIAIVLAVLGLGLGVIIGYFAANNASTEEAGMFQGTCGAQTTFYNPTVKSNMDTCVAGCRSAACTAQSCQIPEPRSYVAYHLQDKTITVDGNINEEAWNEVPWTEKFVDIRGGDYPAPHFDTKVKIRWNDSSLYVAAYLKDDDIWASKTVHDSHVFLDNALEIYFDVDGSTHNYKQISINALKTTNDLMMPKAYTDGGYPLVRLDWESNVEVGVYTDGTVNDPTSRSTFWSIELVFPISQLQVDTRRVGTGGPADSEIWRTVFARSEWPVKVIDGRYEKVEGKAANWWSWNPHGAVDLHLPDKWGLLQFSRAAVKSKLFTTNEQWRVSQALFDSFNALKIFKAEHAKFTTELGLLDMPQYLLSGLCVGTPKIQVISWNWFIISVSSKDGTVNGHIREDRYVWFGDIHDGMHKSGTTVNPNMTTYSPLDV